MGPLQLKTGHPKFISENISRETAVYVVSATDPDANSRLKYSIIGGDDAPHFSIDSATGVIKFKLTPNYEAPADIDANNIYNIKISASDGSLTTQKEISITVTDIDETPKDANVVGTRLSDNLSDFNQKFWGGSGDDSITGFGFANTSIYGGVSKEFNISLVGSKIQISDLITNREGTDQLYNIQKIQFNDFTLDTTMLTKTASLSSDQIVDLVELYIASFNRAPDSVGLYYWGSRLSDGMSLLDIAQSFFDQPETIAAYPSNMETTDFVTKVYNNV
jgi:hypothetical protein